MEDSRRATYFLPANILVIKLESQIRRALLAGFPDGIHKGHEPMHRVENPLRLCRVGFGVLLQVVIRIFFWPCCTDKATYYQTEQHEVSRPYQSWCRCIRNERFWSNPAVVALMVQRPIEERPDLTEETSILELERQGYHAIAGNKCMNGIITGGDDRSCDLQPIWSGLMHQTILDGSTLNPYGAVDATRIN